MNVYAFSRHTIVYLCRIFLFDRMIEYSIFFSSFQIIEAFYSIDLEWLLPILISAG